MTVDTVGFSRWWKPPTAINDIYFRDKEDGFLIAGNAIFATRDNGTRWTEVRRFLPTEFDGADVELYSVRFSSKKKGWVVGSVSKRDRVIDSILLYTDNGGETWQRQRAPSRLELIHIDFANDKRGWIVGTGGNDSRYRRRRTNLDQTRVGNDRHDLPRRFSQREKRAGGRRAGHDPAHHRRRADLDPVEIAKRSTLLNVQFVNDDKGWAVGRGGTILRTDDGGATWIEQESGTKENLYGLYFVKKIGWAVGGDGMLLRYEQ